MKKLFLLAVALVGAAAVSVASPLSCGGDLIPGGVGSGLPGFTPLTCPTIGNAGDNITSITLTILSDYTGWISGDPIVTITYAFSGPITFAAVAPQQVVTLNQNPKNSQPVTVTSTGSLGVGPISGITITPTSSITGGAVTASSAEVSIDYTTSAAPEPASVGLTGAALLGVGLLSRRRAKK